MGPWQALGEKLGQARVVRWARVPVEELVQDEKLERPPAAGLGGLLVQAGALVAEPGQAPDDRRVRVQAGARAPGVQLEQAQADEPVAAARPSEKRLKQTWRPMRS